MSETDGNGDDLVSDFPVAAPEHGDVVALKTVFQAWHHPRKHHVRVQHWCAAARAYMRANKIGKGSTLRYLTLPGDELLDVRALYGVTSAEGALLRYLGFNSASPDSKRGAELALSQSEVRALPGIDQLSNVVIDRFEALGLEAAVAIRQAEESGPFHVVNIDLTECIASKDSEDPKGSYFDAVTRLLHMQARSTEPWLLFITTNAARNAFTDQSKQRFADVVKGNLSKSAAFGGALAELTGIGQDALEAALVDGFSTQNEKLIQLFSAALAKWLIAVAGNQTPPRKLRVVSGCYYKSGPEGPDMLSLVIECGAVAKQTSDPTALSRAAGVDEEYDEPEIARAAIVALGGVYDLDKRLKEDKAAAEKAVNQSARLMKTARFSEPDYRKWAEALFNSAG